MLHCALLCCLIGVIIAGLPLAIKNVKYPNKHRHTTFNCFTKYSHKTLADIFQIYFTKKRKVPTTTDTRKSIKNYKFQQWRATLEGRGCGERIEGQRNSMAVVWWLIRPLAQPKKRKDSRQTEAYGGNNYNFISSTSKKKEAIKRVSFSDHYCSV